MNASQRRRRALVEDMIEICLARGLGSFDLREVVHDAYIHPTHPDSTAYPELWTKADRISRAGLMAQLYFLVDAKGAAATFRWLEKNGSELDGFVKGFSTDPEKREADIGRDNVDDDGCVITD